MSAYTMVVIMLALLLFGNVPVAFAFGVASTLYIFFNDLPIALTCKPHPEGMLHGRPHPLAAVARCSSRSFEDALAEADIVVWDYGSSTAFWQTLATALPVVLVDLGNCPRTALGERMVAARCRVLRPSFDARGRPLLERQALRDAVLDTPAPADPEPFRRFLLGRA